MSAMASRITGVTIVYLTVCSGADQRKHQSSASLAFRFFKVFTFNMYEIAFFAYNMLHPSIHQAKTKTAVREQLAFKMMTSQPKTPKDFGLMSIRNRPDMKVAGRCLIEVGSRVFVIFAEAFLLSSKVTCYIGPATFLFLDVTLNSSTNFMSMLM